MGIAASIQYRRIRLGKSQTEMAGRLGLNPAWYADLEQNDDELASTLTIFQAMELASILGTRLEELLSDERAPNVRAPDERILLTALPGLLEAHLARSGIAIDEFEDQVGWEVRDLLDSPIKAAAELPIAFFQAVAERLQINWMSLIPDAEETCSRLKPGR